MDDKTFVTQLNNIARDNSFKLPVLGRDESPDGKFISDWALFLELCVKKGLSLADSRWQQLHVEAAAPHTRFSIETSGAPSTEDADFRVGLQLLMGMLGSKDQPDN